MGPAATTVALRRAVRVERGQLTDHVTGTDHHLVVGEVHLGLALEEEERLGAALALLAQHGAGVEVQQGAGGRQAIGGGPRVAEVLEPMGHLVDPSKAHGARVPSPAQKEKRIAHIDFRWGPSVEATGSSAGSGSDVVHQAPRQARWAHRRTGP